eukprot:8298896-Prorocentrum_lima.AAC.1
MLDAMPVASRRRVDGFGSSQSRKSLLPSPPRKAPRTCNLGDQAILPPCGHPAPPCKLLRHSHKLP